jgi:hypothetical protein
MKQYLSIALILLLLAGGGAARAQQTNTNSLADQDLFQIITLNNIFDQSRVWRGNRPSAAASNRPPTVEMITLCGIGTTDRVGAANFRGSNKWFKSGEIYKGLKIARITVDSVTLTKSSGVDPTNFTNNTLILGEVGDDLSVDNTSIADSSGSIFVLDLDTHPTLRREGNGPWRLSGYIAPELASATNSAATNMSATASGKTSFEEILRQRRLKALEEK